ncbi:hypothetical protein CU098_002025, partial [Rhizopus stolonifer]
LVEMAVLKKLGKKKQWECIAYLEGLKVMLRLFLYQSTEQRMTLSPTHLQRDVDPQALVEPQAVVDSWVGKRTGIRVQTMNDCVQFHNHPNGHAKGDVTDFLLSRRLTAEMLRRPDQMVAVQKNISKLAELLYIFRPLLYVLSILKWGRRSWRPWFVSLVIELLSQVSLKAGYKSSSGRQGMTTLEKEEYQRRSKLLFFNLMRGAFYLKITRPRLERFCNKTESKPILSMVSIYWISIGTKTTWSEKKTENIFSNLNQKSSESRVLILTPFKQSAHLIDRYFENLEKLTYPHHLISVGVLVSDSTDGTLEKIRSRAYQQQHDWQRFNQITILQKDFKYELPNNEDRHNFDVQIQRRAIMSKSRNTLLSAALNDKHDWVLWLDGDVVEYPETLLEELIALDKDVIAPNCWWHSYNEEGGYDKNNWQETEASLEFQKSLPHDAVLVEGYENVLLTHRKLMINMRTQGDIYDLVPLDAVGGTCTFVKAQVHRDGAIFPPFPYQHQVETEGFAQMAKSLGYKIWGLPNYLVYHYI